MAFIRLADFNQVIKLDLLEQIIEGDFLLLDAQERVAVEEASSYFNNRFDAPKIFAEIFKYDPAAVYPKDTRVAFFADAFAASSTYAIGAVVSYEEKIWQAIVEIDTAAPWNESQWNQLCEEGALFYVIVDETTAGTLPTNTTEFKAGDTRNPTVLMYTIDIALYHVHTRLNPRQIPEIRVNRYQAAIDYLKDVAEGVVTPSVPIRKDNEDKDIMNFRMGSNQRFKSDY